MLKIDQKAKQVANYFSETSPEEEKSPTTNIASPSSILSKNCIGSDTGSLDYTSAFEEEDIHDESKKLIQDDHHA